MDEHKRKINGGWKFYPGTSSYGSYNPWVMVISDRNSDSQCEWYR